MREKFTQDFPVLAQYTYANTAATGLLSESLMDWRQEHDIDFLIGGSTFKEEALRKLEVLRQDLARTFGAQKELTFLAANFSYPFQQLVNMLPKAETAVVLEGDYPSVIRPFQLRKSRLVRVAQEPGYEAALLRAVETEKPDVVALSLVQYTAGNVVSKKLLEQLKALHPEVLILADGTQMLGAREFRLEDWPVDALFCSGYKWLLSGFGNGFGMISPSLAAALEERLSMIPEPVEVFLKGRSALQMVMEPGHLDTLNLGSLHFMLKYLESEGWENIWNYLGSLGQKGFELFERTGLLHNPGDIAGAPTTIFCLQEHPKVVQALNERGVVYTSRGGKLRLSFHYYNSLEEVERIAKIVSKAKS